MISQRIKGSHRSTLPGQLNQRNPIDFDRYRRSDVVHFTILWISCSVVRIMVSLLWMEIIVTFNNPKRSRESNCGSDRKDVLIAGTYSGLYLLMKRGTSWRVESYIEGFTRSCKDMLMEDSTHILWVGNKENGVCRLILADDLRKVEKMKDYNSIIFPR